MKQYYLQIRTRNKKSLKHFFKFFFKHLKTQLNIFATSTLNQKNKKIITLLKSPHVNKSAQEHFELNTISKKLLLKTSNLKISSILLKKVLNSLFHDILINLRLITYKVDETENNNIVFHPDNFKIIRQNRIKFNKRRDLQKKIIEKFFNLKHLQKTLLTFLNLISIFGETLTLQLKINKLSK